MRAFTGRRSILFHLTLFTLFFLGAFNHVRGAELATKDQNLVAEILNWNEQSHTYDVVAALVNPSKMPARSEMRCEHRAGGVTYSFTLQQWDGRFYFLIGQSQPTGDRVVYVSGRMRWPNPDRDIVDAGSSTTPPLPHMVLRNLSDVETTATVERWADQKLRGESVTMMHCSLENVMK